MYTSFEDTICGPSAAGEHALTQTQYRPAPLQDSTKPGMRQLPASDAAAQGPQPKARFTTARTYEGAVALRHPDKVRA
jgi:hypothetical protein